MSDGYQWGKPYGSYAEFIAVPEEQVAAVPEGVSWEAAAALPTAALTVLQVGPFGRQRAARRGGEGRRGEAHGASAGREGLATEKDAVGFSPGGPCTISRVGHPAPNCAAAGREPACDKLSLSCSSGGAGVLTVPAPAGRPAPQALEPLGLKKFDRLLVHGGAGGVGSTAIQVGMAGWCTLHGTAWYCMVLHGRYCMVQQIRITF